MSGQSGRHRDDVERAPAGDADLRLYLLGGFHLVRDGAAVHLPRSCQRLVCYVAVRGRSPRRRLAALLWPDLPDGRALGNLRSALWRVQARCPGLLTTGGDGIDVAGGVSTDLASLEEWARELITTVPGAFPASVDVPPPPMPDDLLPGWTEEEWLVGERERVRQLRLHALEALARHLIADGRSAVALDVAFEALRLDPLRESTHRLVLEVHRLEGNPREAVRHYESCRRLLDDELGVGPTPELEALVAGLLDDRAPAQSEPPSAEATRPPTVRPSRRERVVLTPGPPSTPPL